MEGVKVVLRGFIPTTPLSLCFLSSHIIQHNLVELDENLSYNEQLVALIDKQVKCLHSKNVASMKVIWRGLSGEETT